MEKILLAIDALNPNEGAVDFAAYLARLTSSVVTGAFLENIAGSHVCEVEEITDKRIQNFKRTCETLDTKCKVHRDRNVPQEQLLKESRFADVIVIPPDMSFSSSPDGIPTTFVSNILSETECPVIISPPGFRGTDEIILTYNGSASCIHAIKLFTYLFSQLSDKKLTILQAGEEIPGNKNDTHVFSEWLMHHYTRVHFEVLNGQPNNTLFSYLLKKENVFIVMGAYGRSSLSQFFKPSHADILIKTLPHPIFIAHL